jgi:outer membrane immunogenic protein
MPAAPNSSHDSPADPLIILSTGNFPVSGAMVGGTIGFNFQKDNLVAGIEFDAGWANIKGRTSNNCGGMICETSNPGIVTLRARLGYAFDRILPFATIGVALGDVRAEVIGSGATDPQNGLGFGAGVEYALGIKLDRKAGISGMSASARQHAATVIRVSPTR